MLRKPTQIHRFPASCHTIPPYFIHFMPLLPILYKEQKCMFM